MFAPLPAAPRRVPGSTARDTVPAVRLPQLSAAVPTRSRPPDGGRNPFEAAVAMRPVAPLGPRSAPAAPVHTPPLPAAPSWPRLDLIGVAEAQEGAAVVRTAVIAGPRGVQHARPGDLLEQVYRLERVTPAGVDLRLLPEDRLVHLALRP